MQNSMAGGGGLGLGLGYVLGLAPSVLGVQVGSHLPMVNLPNL